MNKLVKINSKLFPDRYKQFTDFVASYGVIAIEENEEPILYLDPRYIDLAKKKGKRCLPLDQLPRKNCVLHPFEWRVAEIVAYGFIDPMFNDDGGLPTNLHQAIDNRTVEILMEFASKNDIEYFYHGHIFTKKKIVPNQACIEYKFAYFDPEITYAAYLHQLDLSKMIDDPIKIQESIVEDIEKYQQFMHKDTIAWMQFWEYVANHAADHTEISLTHKLIAIKEKAHINADKNNVDTKYEEAFEMIVGNNENSAYIHARATDKVVEPGTILVDSGSKCGDYVSDITRVFKIGNTVSSEIQAAYTKVLIAFVEIATAEFQKLEEIDQIARIYTEFGHATGHGVGKSVVHAFPTIRSANRGEPVAFKENMLLALEPGFYSVGKFGVRLEGEFLIKSSGSSFYLECLTFIPFEYDLINFSMLEKKHTLWLSNFHKICYEMLVGYVDNAFLLRKVEPFILHETGE